VERHRAGDRCGPVDAAVAQFAGFYVAKEKGFYSRQNLNVHLEPGGLDFPAIQLVGSGTDDFGVTGAEEILLARSKGIPVVAIALIYNQSPFCLFAYKKTGIDSVKKLIGKRVGVLLGSNEMVAYRAMLKSENVRQDQIHEIPVADDLQPLKDGLIDVWPGYSIDEALEIGGESFDDVALIRPETYGVKLYGDTLFTTEEFIEEHGSVVQRFVSATIEGWHYSIENEKNRREAVEIVLHQDSSPERPLGRRHQDAMLRASIPFIAGDTKSQAGATRLFGCMSYSNWKTLQELLKREEFLDKSAACQYTSLI
jgi:NitT/TauT family transport system substrate-binding protein